MVMTLSGSPLPTLCADDGPGLRRRWTQFGGRLLNDGWLQYSGPRQTEMEIRGLDGSRATGRSGTCQMGSEGDLEYHFETSSLSVVLSTFVSEQFR